MRIAITTIARGAPVDTPGGWLRVVELERAQQIALAPLPDAVHRARDTNPRGGLRGGRGLAATSDRLALAIHDRILILDPAWGVTRILSHRWMGGIHDLAADASGVWATCADNDLLVRLDWEGRLQDAWQWRTDRRVRRALGQRSLPGLSRWADHRDPANWGLRMDVGHVNAIALEGEGLVVGLGMIRPPVLAWPQAALATGLRCATLLGLREPTQAMLDRVVASPLGRRILADPRVAPSRPGFNRTDRPPETRPGWAWAVLELRLQAGAIGRRPRARVVAHQPSAGLPTHNVVPFDGLIAVNDSSTGRVLAIDHGTGAIARSVQLPGELPFPRGLLRLASGHFAVGTQAPATIQIVDLEAGRIEERIELPDDRDEAPYAIVQVPERFADPTGRLPAVRADWGVIGADASGPSRVGTPPRSRPGTAAAGRSA